MLAGRSWICFFSPAVAFYFYLPRPYPRVQREQMRQRESAFCAGQRSECAFLLWWSMLGPRFSPRHILARNAAVVLVELAAMTILADNGLALRCRRFAAVSLVMPFPQRKIHFSVCRTKCRKTCSDLLIRDMNGRIFWRWVWVDVFPWRLS